MDGFSTRALHADASLSESPDVAPPISVSSTFVDGTGRRYRRSSHSTTERLEAVLGSLDGGHATAYASGMAAASGVFDVVQPRKVSLPEDVYHGVRDLVWDRSDRGMLEVVAPEDLTRGDLWWIETPSNPKCLITDLEDVAARTSGTGIVTVCDATFATPVLMQPLTFGIDVVMHSMTKFIAGHSDALGGVLVTRDESLAARLTSTRSITGAVPGSLDAWLALRGVRTLELRVLRASSSARDIARWFVDRDVHTWHPGLDSHDGHEIASRQMSGYGSMMSIDLESAEAADRFVSRLSVFTNATSLGGVESLAEHRLRSDPHIEPGLVRLSIGIEDVTDLITDLDQALSLPQ
ncbi:MAG: PLP-dependent aspartate aminotransferase family protein [Actinomycetia bacterium]|nr:PLP-dependent aspartate aminotransferase family protein [Actinomycetes bacterium]